MKIFSFKKEYGSCKFILISQSGSDIVMIHIVSEETIRIKISLYFLVPIKLLNNEC